MTDPASSVAASWTLPRVIKILEGLSYVAAVMTLGIIAWQLYEDAEQRRAAHSFEFIDRHETGKILEQRSAISDFELAHRDELQAITENGGLSLEDAQIWIDGRLESYANQQGNAEVYGALRDVASFYDQVEKCIDASHCSEEILDTFLLESAREFHCNYGLVIRQQAVIFARPGLGTGLRAFVEDEQCLSS